MEGGKLRAYVMIVLVLGMLVGHSSASFKKCYGRCFVGCVLHLPPNVLSCGVKCIKDCIIPIPEYSAQGLAQPNTHKFCKFGCASSKCANISTLETPGEEKVESCVDSCSETCSKNYLLG